MHEDDHHHDHDDHSHLSEMELRVRALESILVEKGYVDPKALDVLIETYETKVGPHNGAKVVAKAWADRELQDPAPRGRDRGDRRVRLHAAGRASTWSPSRTPARCTTSSFARCAPAIRGPCSDCRRSGTSPRPTARAPSASPRSVLADFGVTLPSDKEIKVWDSTAEVRYLVLPERPAGTDGWNEERLAALVTRDSMIGTGLPKAPARTPMNGAHDMGGTMGFGPVVPEKDEPVFHAPWERRAFAITLAMGAGRWNIDQSRSAREQPAARPSTWPRPITRSGSPGSRS